MWLDCGRCDSGFELVGGNELNQERSLLGTCFCHVGLSDVWLE
jgi:hypothetical protein